MTSQLPSIRPSLVLDFANSRRLDPRIAFSSTSARTFIDRNRVLSTAPANVARFDHDPVTGQSLGLLVRPQEQNLLLRSEDFSTTWSNAGTTETVNATLAPDENFTADKIIEEATTGVHLISQAFTPLNGVTYTSSIFLKAAERGFAFFGFSGGSMGLNMASVNLSTGAVATAVGTPAIRSPEIFPNGWYRFSAAFTSAGTSLSSVEVRLSTDGVWANRSYTGVAGSGVFAFGAQLNPGSVAHSYVPTTTATVTASADVVDLIGAAIANNIRTLVVEFRSPAVGTSGVVSINDNTANERIGVNVAGTDPRLVVVDGGVEQANINGGTIVAGARSRVAVRIGANDFAMSFNGGAVVADTSGTLPTVDRLMLGRTQAGEYLGGTIARVFGWNMPMSDATLQALSR